MALLIRNSETRFGLITKAVHWLTAFLVLTLFPLGYYVARLKPQSLDEVERTFFLFSLHKTLGMMVLTLSVLRIAMLFLQPRPHPMTGHRPVEHFVAQTVHWLLYVLIILMPLTGWLHHSATFGYAEIWGPFPQRIGFVPESLVLEEFFVWAHFATGMLLGAVVILHVMGALKHALLDRDETLRRMLPGAGGEDEAAPAPVGERPARAAALVILVLFIAGVVILGPESSEPHEETGTAQSE